MSRIDPDNPSIEHVFDFSSLYTTTKACPIDYYQISDDFYDNDPDYYNYPTGLNLLASQNVDESPSPTVSGTVSSQTFQISKVDNTVVETINFKIKAFVLGGLSTFVTPILAIKSACPILIGISSELEDNIL